MCSFQCVYHQSVLQKKQKKQLLYVRWLLASLVWYLTGDFNFLGLFHCIVGLTTKCTTVKVSENVVEEEPQSQTRVDMANIKNEALVECVNKNSRKLICVTNHLETLLRAASKVFR